MQKNNNNPNILSDSIALFSHKGQFNIKTNNMHIYDTAFSHSSYCNEHDSLEDY